MRICCKLIRPGGTSVELGTGPGKRVYHFRPLDPTKATRDHVADVTNKDDIATFLAIPEGYEVHDSELKQAPPPTPAPRASAPEPPAGGESSQVSQGGEQDKGRGASTEGTDYSKLSKPELLKLVEEKTGEKPHHSTSVNKLIATLTAAT